MGQPARRRPPRSAPGAIAGQPAREAAVALITAVIRDGAPLDEALSAAMASGPLGRLEERDRALARAITATALRRLPQIEAVLAAFLKSPIDHRGGAVRDILIAGAAQILFMEMAPHAVVNISTAQAAADRRGRGLKGVVNAVLRRLAGEGPAILAGQDAAAMVLPDWLARRWHGAYGADAVRAIAALHLAEPPLDLTVRRDGADWAARLGGTVPAPGTVRLERAGRIEALEGYREGAWWVQDVAAALPVALLGDIAGLDVIDLCAAPGGKTAGLAAAGARVTAVERAPGRMARLNANLARLGLEARTVVADACDWRPETLADAVIVDAPCSATGIMRRHPDILRRRRPEHIAPLVQLQERLLAAALEMVRPGGRIVYCTCSLEHEEGEDQISRLIAAGAPVAVRPVTPGEAPRFAASITRAGTMRVLPGVLEAAGGCDGFFIAVLDKLEPNQGAGC